MTEQDDLDLLRRFDRHGDADALGRFLARHRDRLRTAVAARIGRRLAARLDPSDVVQEATAEVPGRVAGYLQTVAVPPFVWLRFLALQQLRVAARRHLGTQRRAADREDAGGLPVGQLIDPALTPARSAVRAEVCRELQAALAELPPADRQVLALRHFSQLDNAEVARLLGLAPNTVCVRYLRALRRLRPVLDRYPALAPDL
jgi:RNA polymerase sigma-70 factor (ECF subfamily)